MKTLLALLALHCSLHAQLLPQKTLQAILTAQDIRDAQALTGFLTDNTPEVRASAAFASGSVQDTVHIALLLNLLADKSSQVRAAAAFALGQLNFVIDSTQRQDILRILLKKLRTERNREVLLRIVEALGKTGDDRSLNAMIESAENISGSSFQCEVALAVGRFGYRGVASKSATAFVVGLVNATNNSPDSSEWKAAYALMRIGDAALLSNHTDDILRATSSRYPDVRMFAAASLARLASLRKVVNVLLSLVRSDKDWRVRVNAIKALARVDSLEYSRVAPLLLNAIADSNELVSLTVLTTLGDIGFRESLFKAECAKALAKVVVEGKYSQRQKKEAAIALGKVLGKGAYWALVDDFKEGHLTKSSFVASLANVPTRNALQNLLELSNEGDVRLQREALEAMQSIVARTDKNSELSEMVKPAFLGALQSPDMTVVATAASALAESVVVDDKIPELLATTLRRLKRPDESEAMVAVIQALGRLKAFVSIGPIESALNNPDRNVAIEAARALERITGKPYAHIVKAHSIPLHTNFDWKLLETVRKYPTVSVTTSKGNFVFQMLPDESPFTCVNFASLIKKGFFDNLLFHRVVPNFVVQGGDPRGDGWGGPGYTIRSEFGFEHYGRGMVGVASSGKDTEGCQWFVTHCSTPHLDGRYTIFGRVTSGMDVVDAIGVGDTIVTMRLEN